MGLAGTRSAGGAAPTGGACRSGTESARDAAERDVALACGCCGAARASWGAGRRAQRDGGAGRGLAEPARQRQERGEGARCVTGPSGATWSEVSWAAQWFDRAGVLGLGWILGWGFGPEERAGRAGLLAGFWAGLVWVLGWFGFLFILLLFYF